MKKFKLLVLATVASAAVLSAQAFATPTTATVDGITFNTESFFYVTSIYENKVSAPGDDLSGYGQIGFTLSDGISCADGPCTLTFEFSGYTVTKITPSTIDFDGGTISFYANHDGEKDLFLSTTGHTYLDRNSGREGTLLGISNDSSLTGSQPKGSGIGELDVTGGDAAAYFDTNTIIDGLGHFADLIFDSSFSAVSCPADSNEPICGSGDLHGLPVPEPGSLALFGLGLIGLGVTFRNRKRRG